MVFLKYVAVFVGVYLIVAFVTALIIGPYAGAIGFIVGIVGVIYYRGRRRIRAAEDEFVKVVTDSMIAESKRLESRSKPLSDRPTAARTQQARPNQSSRKPSQSRRQHVSARRNTSTPGSNSRPNPSMTRAQQIGMSKKESEESMRNAERTRALQKKDLLEFLKNMDQQALEHAVDVLGMDVLYLRPNQKAVMRPETVKSLLLNSVAKKGNVDRKAIISSFKKDDLRRALNLVPSGQMSETVALVNEVLGVAKPPDIKEDVPEETLKQPIASEISPFCLKCGYDNPVVAKHCISCGEQLPDLICPKCETENIAEAKFCMGCGEER